MGCLIQRYIVSLNVILSGVQHGRGTSLHCHRAMKIRHLLPKRPEKDPPSSGECIIVELLPGISPDIAAGIYREIRLMQIKNEQKNKTTKSKAKEAPRGEG